MDKKSNNTSIKPNYKIKRKNGGTSDLVGFHRRGFLPNRTGIKWVPSIVCSRNVHNKHPLYIATLIKTTLFARSFLVASVPYVNRRNFFFFYNYFILNFFFFFALETFENNIVVVLAEGSLYILLDDYFHFIYLFFTVIKSQWWINSWFEWG